MRYFRAQRGVGGLGGLAPHNEVKKCGKIEVGGGPSRAADAAGTVYAIDVGRNVYHSSDS